MDQPAHITETANPPVRHILHADMDAFYAAVEQMDNPELRGKPVMVGGRPEGRGVVATASYEARVFGVHSAMPMKSAVRRCPQGIVVPPRFGRYRELSGQVIAIFREVTPLVEALSLDEAYLDITQAVAQGKPPLAVALDLKQQVKEETGLIVSIGVATNKTVAKIGSDLNKPDGLVVVAPGEEADFLAPLAVGKLWGVGPKTAERLAKEGVETIGQLAAQPLDWFTKSFGQRATGLRARALGLDQDPVQPVRETKSVSAENTFSTDLSDQDQLREELVRLSANVARHLAAHSTGVSADNSASNSQDKGLRGKTITLKARLADFTTFTRQVTLPEPTGDEAVILENAWMLLSRELNRESESEPGRADETPPSFRLLGVGVSGFSTQETPQSQQLQLPLFE